MPVLPATGSFLPLAGSNESRGQLLEAWLAFSRTMLGGAAEQQAAIAGGSVTPTAPLVQIDTEGQTASDDLDYLVGTAWQPGQIVCIRSRDASRIVNVRHARGTTNEIFLIDGQTLPLKSSSQLLFLVRYASQWREMYRFYGTQHVDFRSWIGLGDVQTRHFVSAELPVTGGAGGSYNHNLGGKPTFLQGSLICKVSEEGYAVDDEMALDSGYGFDASRHIMIGCSATQVFYRVIGEPEVGDETLFGVNRVSGSVQLFTASRWRLIIRARR